MNDLGWLNFKPGSEEASAILSWWKSLDQNRGDRAALRRCHTPTEVLFIPAYHQLRARLAGLGAPLNEQQRERLAVLAGVLAHVRMDTAGDSLPRQMARTSAEGGRARVSPSRFRRLLRDEQFADLFPALVRVVRLLDRTVNVSAFASDGMNWSDSIRRQWAEQYYETAPEQR